MKKHCIIYSILSIILITVIALSVILYNVYQKTNTELVVTLNNNIQLVEENKILNEKVETLMIEVSAINTQLENLSTENTTLKEENLNLQKQVSTLKNEAKSKTEIISAEKVPEQTGKVAYLTFDDGPSNNTIKILDELKKHNILATFFINGNYNKETIQRIINEGHAIGNHTNSHNYKTIYTSVDAFINDFKILENKLQTDFGITTQVMRFPGGSNNTVSHNYGGKEIMNTLTKIMSDNGYKYFDWNVTSGDADSTPATKEQIINNVLNRSQNKKNAIILMHDSSTKVNTADALPEIINGLKSQGFSFNKLSIDSPTVQFQ